jgi:hypothetical protein
VILVVLSYVSGVTIYIYGCGTIIHVMNIVMPVPMNVVVYVVTLLTETTVVERLVTLKFVMNVEYMTNNV